MTLIQPFFYALFMKHMGAWHGRSICSYTKLFKPTVHVSLSSTHPIPQSVHSSSSTLALPSISIIDNSVAGTIPLFANVSNSAIDSKVELLNRYMVCLLVFWCNMQLSCQQFLHALLHRFIGMKASKKRSRKQQWFLQHTKVI